MTDSITHQQLELNEKTMRLALETNSNEGKYLGNPNTLLKSEGFYRKHTVNCVHPVLLV